jgi:hypothetical protein
MRLYVYEATISRGEIDAKLNTTLTNDEWLNLCEYMSNSLPRIGVMAMGTECLSRALDYYRTMKATAPKESN